MGAETDRPAKGTKLYMLNDAGTTWLEIALRISLSGPSAIGGTREIKHLDLTHIQRKGTIADTGPTSGNLYYDPKGDTHKLIPPIVRSCATRQFIMRFNTEDVDPDDNYAIKFPGIWTEFQPTANEVDGALEASFNIAVADAPTEGDWATLSAITP